MQSKPFIRHLLARLVETARIPPILNGKKLLPELLLPPFPTILFLLQLCDLAALELVVVNDLQLFRRAEGVKLTFAVLGKGVRFLERAVNLLPMWFRFDLDKFQFIMTVQRYIDAHPPVAPLLTEALPSCIQSDYSRA